MVRLQVGMADLGADEFLAVCWRANEGVCYCSRLASAGGIAAPRCS